MQALLLMPTWKNSELISRLEEPHEEFLVIDETVVATKEKIKQKPAEKSIEKLKLIVAAAEQK